MNEPVSKRGRRSAPVLRKASSPPPEAADARSWREWLIATFGMLAAAPLIGLFAGFLLLFGGMFLGIAWQAAMKPLVDMRQYAAFTSATSGRIVESWAALDFDPANLAAGKLYWDRVSKISRCAVVEYQAGDWGAPLRRAFCGMRLNFSDRFRLADWDEALQDGIPFTFLRDASGFEVQEVRLSKATLDWISRHSPRDTFGMSKPPPATALAALREQFDWPVDIAVLSWTREVPEFPLRFDPQRPQEAMPARFVEDSRQWNPAGAIIALVLAVPGFWVWRMGMRVFFLGEPSRVVLWGLTLLPLLALPWWGEMLPKLLAHANRNWASVAGDMLDDVTRSARLNASAPERAEFAQGERLLWRLDQGEYADTFGRIRYAKPKPAPTTEEEVVAALQEQTAVQVAKMSSQEQLALFLRLMQDKEHARDRVQIVFAPAAEAVERDPRADPAVHRAARRFLLFGANYNVWDVDALEKSWAAPAER